MKPIQTEDPTPVESFDEDAGQEQEGRGRSVRKRAATAAQELGMRLVGLSAAELTRLPIPEPLREAIRAAQNIRSRGGLARQRQYIGKLMRDIDPAPLLTVLEGRSRAQALEAERFRRIETWRDRLIAEGEGALPHFDEWEALSAAQRATLSKLVQRARRNDSSAAQRTTAGRELFRTLRTMIGATSRAD